jgi:hypothetical protein
MVAVKDVKAMPILSPYKGRRDAELEERTRANSTTFDEKRS